jgi:hypothetical protein
LLPDATFEVTDHDGMVRCTSPPRSHPGWCGRWHRSTCRWLWSSAYAGGLASKTSTTNQRVSPGAMPGRPWAP